jgi:hypothetical protein
VGASWQHGGPAIVALSGAVVGVFAGAAVGAGIGLAFAARDWLLLPGRAGEIPVTVPVVAGVCGIVGASGMAHLAAGGDFFAAGYLLTAGAATAASVPGAALGVWVAWLLHRTLGRDDRHEKHELARKDENPARPQASSGQPGGPGQPP